MELEQVSLDNLILFALQLCHIPVDIQVSPRQPISLGGGQPSQEATAQADVVVQDYESLYVSIFRSIQVLLQSDSTVRVRDGGDD